MIGGLMVSNYTSFEAFDFSLMAWLEIPFKPKAANSFDCVYFFSFRRALGVIKTGENEFLIFGGCRKLQRMNSGCIITIRPDCIGFR